MSYIAKTTFLVYILLQIVWDIFNYFYVIGPKSVKFGRIMQTKRITPFRVIQGHRFWY